MTARYFFVLGLIGFLPWVFWQESWPSLVVEQLDHCPIVMCDFQRHYLPQAEIVLDKPLSLVRGWFYPPLLALALLPFVWSGQALGLWGLLLFGSIVALTHLSLKAEHRKALPFALTLLFISSSLPILHGLKWGQISLLLVVFTLFGLLKGGWKGGVWIGLAAAIKGYPAVYLLQPLLQSKLKPVMGAAAAFVLLGIGLPCLILGAEDTHFLYLNMSKSSPFVMLGAPESGGQALQATLKRWFIDGTHVGRLDSLPRIVALPDIVVLISWLLCSATLAGITIQYSRKRLPDPIPSICIVLCFIGLMLPPGWHHYFAFLPFVQLQLLQNRPHKGPLILLAFAILMDRLPVLGLGFSAHSYAVASSLGCTTMSVLLSWLAWIVHLSSKDKRA